MISTPIGNLEDITLRALRVLGQVGLVAAEDTRSARRLMAHHGLKARLVSFYEGNKGARLPLLMDALREGDIALMSEAGTPVVSDPGRELVAEAAAMGFQVVAVPGPSAVTAALTISGFDAGSFRFLGFLPRRSVERRRALANVVGSQETLVIFEAPHRLRASLKDMAEVLGHRQVAVCREMTKIYEEVFRGTISEALDYFEEPRGEYTLVVQGASAEAVEPDIEAASRELARLKANGVKAREAVATVVAVWGVSRKEAYRLWLSAAGSREATPG